jgi:CRP-like cAMP-binding protein
VRQQCLAQGEVGRVRLGEELVRQGERSKRMFFPFTAVCSLTVELSSGDKAEAGTVGSEGFVGLAFLDGAGRCPFSAVVQVEGEGLFASQSDMLSVAAKSPELRKAMMTYVGFTLNVVGSAVACNAYHSIEERMARWLLMTHDRVGASQFALKHETLSQMLAVTRPRVSLAAGKLKKARIIDYGRGTVRIVDRKRLAHLSCECYEAVRKQQRALLWSGT